jgi:hypothetical protein
MALKEVCNVFGEVHKAPNMSVVTLYTPSDTVFREVAKQSEWGYNAPNVYDATSVIASYTPSSMVRNI